MPVKIIVKEGTAVDCAQAQELIKDIQAEHLLADLGYDSNTIVNQAKAFDREHLPAHQTMARHRNSLR